MSNKHKAPGLWVDEHGMVVGQLMGHHQQGHYQSQMHAQRSGGALIVDEAPPPQSHYHGPKVLLDHNDNEMGAGGHYHHRMSGAGGALVNGGPGGKDPNWRPSRRKRKDDDAATSGLVSGVQRLYMNANPHLAIHATGAYHHPTQPAQSVHHHTSHPAQAHPHHPSHQSNSNIPHAKLPPASPGQTGAPAVARAAAGPLANPALTPVGSSASVAILAADASTTTLLLPVLQAAENPRPRRDAHNSHNHHSSNGGSAAAAASPAAVAGSGTPTGSAAQRAPPVQFDLVASAFPPLPGSSPSAEPTAQVVASAPSVAATIAKAGSQPGGTGAAGKAVESRKPAVAAASAPESVSANSSGSEGPSDVQNGTEETEPNAGVAASGTAASSPCVQAPPPPAWGDSLADVVKGTAKVAKQKPEPGANAASAAPPLPTNANGECEVQGRSGRGVTTRVCPCLSDASVSTPKELCQSNVQPPATAPPSSESSGPAKDSNNNVRPGTRSTTNHPVIKPTATAAKATKTDELQGNGEAVAAAAEPSVDEGAGDAEAALADRAQKSSSNVVPTNDSCSSAQASSSSSGVLSYAQVAQREKDLGSCAGPEKEGSKDNNASSSAGAKKKEAPAAAAPAGK